MSFEGYYQKLCKNKHLTTHDAYDKVNTCLICGEEFIWQNLVDQTNTCEWLSCDLPVYKKKLCSPHGCGYIELMIDEFPKREKCKCCGRSTVIEEATYYIPRASDDSE